VKAKGGGGRSGKLFRERGRFVSFFRWDRKPGSGRRIGRGGLLGRILRGGERIALRKSSGSKGRGEGS